MKETEISKYFIDYLADFDLYFEVPNLHVDIVAKNNNILMAFEVKRHLNFKVIEQAARNFHWFHYSYICVPRSKDMGFAAEICDRFGIGILVVDLDKYHKYGHVHEYKKPQFNRKALTKYVNLPEYSKKSIAGASGSDGTTMTAFKMTVENISQYLRRNNGATIQQVYENVDTHYYSISACKSCLYQWIRKGVIREFYISNSRLYLNNNER